MTRILGEIALAAAWLIILPLFVPCLFGRHPIKNSRGRWRWCAVCGKETP